MYVSKTHIDKVMELLYFCVYNISRITILHNISDELEVEMH